MELGLAWGDETDETNELTLGVAHLIIKLEGISAMMKNTVNTVFA